jgi:hypothetical protein
VEVLKTRLIASKAVLMISIVFSASVLSSCGYQGWVRYPCQEFENWEKPECNPPQCLPTGTCTKDIIPGVLDEPKK